MKSLRMVGLVLMLSISICSYAQKVISEGTIVYDISTQTGNKDPQMADALDGATITVSLKGALSRTDMVSSLGSEKTIHDAKTGNAVILKEYSGQKLMITLTKENWDEKNKKFQEITFDKSSETKTIAGHICTKATGKLKDGNVITVYYADDLAVLNKEYDQTFKNLPGLPMQYEFQSGKLKFTYTVSKIDLAPLPVAKFDFPKSGYRVMSYDENVKARKATQ